MPANFTIPLINVVPGQTITHTLWLNEFENIDTNFVPSGMDDFSATDGQMQTVTDPFPSGTSRPTSLQGEIERLRYVIAQITGETYWYIDPDSTIAALHAKFPIQTSSIADDAVTTAKIPDQNVTIAKIALGSINAVRLQDNAVITEKIQDLAVTTAKLDTSSVITNRLNDSAVTTVKIADSNVTKPKILELSKFMAFMSADKSNVTGDGTVLTVVFETEAYDRDSGYDNATGIFTNPNYQGYFLLNVNLSIAGLSAGHTSGWIKINTSNREYVKTLILNTSGTNDISYSIVADMVINDTAYIQIMVAGGTKTVDLRHTSGLTTGCASNFSGALLA